MVVIRTIAKRLQRLLGHAQLDAGQPLDVLDPREPVEPDDRTDLLHAHRVYRQALDALPRSAPERAAWLEPVFDEISFRRDDHLAPDAVRTRDAANQHHLVPFGRPGAVVHQ